MKILIIGGTLFFGKDIVELALEAGHQVTVFSRGNQRPDFWDRVAHISGDRMDNLDFAKKLANQQFDAVIDNIAYNREHVVNALDVFEGNVGRYILTSSIAVNFGIGPFDQPVREGDANFEFSKNPQVLSAPKPTPTRMIEYSTGKIEAEKAVIEQEKAPYTIIRPPVVIGPKGHSSKGIYFYFQRLLDGKPLILTNGGIQSYQPIFSRDLAASYLLALDSSKAVNQVYTIAQTNTFRLIEWVEFAAKCLGLEPSLVPIPANVIQKANFAYEEPWPFLFTLTFDVSKAMVDLDFQPTSVESWTAETVQWYQELAYKHDSPGYPDRAKEIEFAEKYLKNVALLNSDLGV